MNMKLVKKFLTVTLAAAMFVMPITAAAATTDSSEAPATRYDAPVTTEAVATVNTSTSSVAGVGATQVAGVYILNTIKGIAVRANDATISAAGANLAAGEKAFVKAYELTAKSSPAVFASFQGAANSVGGVVVAALNIDFGKLAGKNFSRLAAGVTAPVTIGVPANAPAGKTLAIVKVAPGGATEILPDQDTNPATVSFNITGGLYGYAIIAY